MVQDPAVIQEEQGIVGDEVPAASEEADFLLQVVSLPNREAVKLLDRHPENTEELLLRQVPLQPGSVHTGGQFAPPSVGHHQHLIGVDFMFQHAGERVSSVHPGVSILTNTDTVRQIISLPSAAYQ